MTNRQRFTNFYSAIYNTPLTGQSNTAFGRSIAEYKIYRRTDVSNLNLVRGYYLQARQRLIIPNPNLYPLGAETVESYSNYPAILQSNTKLVINNTPDVRVLEIFPRTLNSQVSVSSTSSSTDSSSQSVETTSGSNTSNVNTFGVNASIGVFGDEPVGDFGLSYSHSWISGSTSSSSTGSGSSSSTNNGFDITMSIKDWSVFSQLSEDNQTLSWVWGQSYPWDVILYNHAESGDNIDLPDFVKERMIKDGIVLPPSELSLFGIDFSSTASWLIDFPDGVTENETLQIEHETTLYTASHALSGKTLTAQLQTSAEALSAQYKSDPLDLSLYSLAPIGGAPVEDPATVGFMVDDFVYPPTKNTDQFKILSSTNDMQVTGQGFDSIMSSNFAANPTLEIQFKVSNTFLNYALVIFHSITGGDCLINWTINDKYSGVKRLDQMQPSEAQPLSTTIDLRDRDYESLNFHDYLDVGLNKISITVTPVDNNSGNSNILYTLLSFSIR